MTEPEARTKPISEVWRLFDALQTRRSYKPQGRRDREFWISQMEELKMLRAVLLERCKEVWDGDESGGTATRFEVIEKDGKRFLKTRSVDIVRQTRIDDDDSALNMSAAYAFWAWELKQRQNESNGR